MKDRRIYRTTRFATVPDWLIGKASLSALGVYVALDRLTFPDGKSNPTRREIAAKIGVSETTVKKAIRELEQAGAVVRRGHVENGITHPNEYLLRRDPPGSDSDPPGAESAPSRASVEEGPRENLETNPPVGPPALASVDRRPVTTGEQALAQLILDDFNEIFGTSFRSTDHLRKIILRIREYPELTREQHRDVMERNARYPWWKGAPSPAVVYGNGALFEKAMLAGQGERENLSAAEVVRIAEEETERIHGEGSVEGEVVAEEDE